MYMHAYIYNIYIYNIYIYIYIYIIYKSYLQQVQCLRVDSCAYLHAQIFWSTCIYFYCSTMAGEQVETWEKYFTELPVLEDQAIRHLYSCNLNLLEHLSCRTHVLVIL